MRGAAEILIVVAVLIIVVGGLVSYSLSARRHAGALVAVAPANAEQRDAAPTDDEAPAVSPDKGDDAQIVLDDSAFVGTGEVRHASADLSVGRQVVVLLPANDTTAFTWRCKWEPAEAMELSEDSYVPDPNPEGAAGAGGTQVYRLRAVQAGLVTVTMERAVWDESGESTADAPVQTRVLTVSVR